MYRTLVSLTMIAGVMCLAVMWIAGCEHPGEVVVRERVVTVPPSGPMIRERVMVAQPTSLSQGPGDVVTTPAPATPTPEPTTPAAGPAYDTEEEAAYFHDDLAPYGTWIEVTEYGPCWQPSDCPPDWRPYTLGHWDYTVDGGWVWISDEPFGWCCYHYGRWAFVASYGWCWVPGRDWCGAWVVWRHGGGYCGWAPMPPVGLGVAVSVEIGEPPHWAFSFCEERFIVDVNLREHCVPVTQNITLINITRNITRVDRVNGRPFNRGPDVGAIEKAIGRPLPRHTLTEVAQRHMIGLRGNSLGVYRPNLPPRPAARPMASRFAASPARVRTESEIARRRDLIDAYHQRLGAEMAARHARELESRPPGPAREELQARHAVERRAFEEQRQREMAVHNAHPRTLRKLPNTR
jgi:hypothetical protein